MRTYDGTCFRPVATRGLPSRYAEYLTMSLDQPGPDSPSQRIVDGENLLHVTDVTQEERYLSGHPYTRALVDLGGARSVIVVALRKDSILLGTITIYRQEARPFTDNQIALLQNFAAQAVIAMENARLITETREALEQQTATAEVLRTIANSPAEAERALDTIAQVTGRLFEASNVNIRRLDGNILRYAASFGASAADFRARVPEGPVDPNTLPGCAIIERRQISIDDVRDPAVLERFPTAALIGTSRSRVATPLLREGQAIGAIITARTAVRSFTEKELDQLKNFADQAVIAMENARLITETREALEQQTATAEVLQVINSSPGDLAPVFDAMLDRAMGLCEASHAHLFTFEGEPTHPVAVRGDPHFVDWLRQQGPHRSPPGSSVDRLRRGEPFVHVLDAREMPAYRADPLFRELIDRSGCRTAISVPLRKEDTVLGMIAVYRQEVRPFSDKQIALLENFAAQAVIAMENARLLTETLEALEQQTATAEVLKVISRSTFDLDAVLQTVVSAAHRLCQSDYSVIFRQQGDEYRWAAGHGISAEYEARERRAVIRPGTDTVIGRAVLAGHAVQIADAKADPLYQGEAENDARAMLGVPLLRDGVAIGGIGMARNRVEPVGVERMSQRGIVGRRR